MTRLAAAVALFAACSAPIATVAAPTTPATPLPSASASPMPSLPSDAAVMARAQEWLHRIQTGRIDRAQLDAQMNALLTADVARRLAAQFGALGQPTSFTPAGKEIVESNTAYIYRVAFATTTLDEIFVLDGSGLISGLRFTPAQ